jgi:hypothetical protein
MTPWIEHKPDDFIKWLYYTRSSTEYVPKDIVTQVGYLVGQNISMLRIKHALEQLHCLQYMEALDFIYARLHNTLILDQTLIDRVTERYMHYFRKWKRLYPDDDFLSMPFVLWAILSELGFRDEHFDKSFQTRDFIMKWKDDIQDS